MPVYKSTAWRARTNALGVVIVLLIILVFSMRKWPTGGVDIVRDKTAKYTSSIEEWLKLPYSEPDPDAWKQPGSEPGTDYGGKDDGDGDGGLLKTGSTPSSGTLRPSAFLSYPPDAIDDDDGNGKLSAEGPGELPESGFVPEYPFQEDLDVALPSRDLAEFAKYRPHNYHDSPGAGSSSSSSGGSSGSSSNGKTGGRPRFAYATFMATRNPSLRDPYFLAVQSVIHRLLYAPRSRTRRGGIPVIAYVAEHVTARQRAVLAGTGAIVRELPAVEWDLPAAVAGPDGEAVVATVVVQKRWRDLFAKLHMWNETEFELVHFLDADAFPLANLDDLFEGPAAPPHRCREGLLDPSGDVDHPTTTTTTTVIESFCDRADIRQRGYVFAGVAQNWGNATDRNVNVGSMLFAPSASMHERLLQNYNKTGRYDAAMAEQAFLNWQFSALGPFPPSYELDRAYNGFFPGAADEHALKVVHEKIWLDEHFLAAPWLARVWADGWAELVRWYSSDEFAESRIKDGLIY